MKRKSIIKAASLFAVFTLSFVFSPNMAQAFGCSSCFTCYIESRAKKDASYYDCGNCTRIHNKKGHGLSYNSCGGAIDIIEAL